MTRRSFLNINHRHGARLDWLYLSRYVTGLLKVALKRAGWFDKFLMVLGALSAIPVYIVRLPLYIRQRNLSQKQDPK